MNQEHCITPTNDLDSGDDDASERIATTLIHPTNECVPPTTATDAEKDATRHLKRQLKQQSRIRKYEMRWSQALGRNDALVANRAQSELRTYLISLRLEPNSWWYQQDFPSFYQDFLDYSNPTTTLLLPSIVALNNEANESSLLVKSRRWMTQQIWQPLVLRMILPTNGRTMDPTISTEQDHIINQETGPSLKQQHTIEARSLLNHMTKGTQTETMFANDAALIGYTRQKFMERALLAFKSLNRLHPLSLASPNTLPVQLWQQLLQVRSILSIGCGPGCDALGVVTFLKHYQSDNYDGDDHDSDKHPNSVVLDRIVWMDFVMPQWKRLVLDHLASLVSTETKLVSRVDMASCDVRYSLCHDARNQEAWECLIQDNLPPIDLIVVSYLLTETRSQWIQFFHDLLSHHCDDNYHDKSCLLLLSEPKAWQLHAFTTEFAHYIDGFQWLDSSRDCPDLQPLERRLGPAVVLVRTKRKV